MKNHKSKRMVITLFILVFIITAVLTGCTQTNASIEDPATIVVPSATPNVTTQPIVDAPSEDTTGVGYISLDVNPSIQLAIKGGIVLNVTAYNDDGEAIVLSCDVVGLLYKDAIDGLISTLNDDGYLTTTDTTPSVVITAYGDVDEAVVENAEAQANESLTTLGVTCPVYASDVSADMAEVAKSYGLTPGRYLLISYLADSEGITIEDAIAKYGQMRMGELTHLVGNFVGVYGDTSSLYEGLTDDQISVLEAAKDAYADAMRAAVEAFRTAKKAAITAFEDAKKAAIATHKETHDTDSWEQAKEAAIAAFKAAKEDAKTVFDAAKAAAKVDFISAVESLGLDPSMVTNLLAWDFDYNWSYEGSWGNKPDDDQMDPEASAHPSDAPSQTPSDKPTDKPDNAHTNNRDGDSSHKQDKVGEKPNK